MKKKYKLLFSISSIFFAFAALVLGVFALTQNTYTVKGSMSYSIEYGLLDIKTSVYKYEGIPITQQQGEEYFEKLDELEPLSQYDRYYCTYDENYILKDTVQNQQLTGLNFEYRDGQAYFVVVHVASETKNKAIKATVETSFNVENSWFVTTGTTIITKNKTGKDIIFAWGVENSAFSSNGNFNFNITFSEDTEYVPQDTGIIDVKIADKSTNQEAYVENFTQQFNTFNEADYYENKMPITIATSQMDSVTEDGETIYFPIINLESGKYGIDVNITYKIKNVNIYDQNNNLIQPNDGDLMYLVVNGRHFVGLEDVVAYLETGSSAPLISETAPEFTTRLKVGESQKDCIIIGLFTEEQTAIIPTKLTFELVVKVQEVAKKVQTQLPYDYKYQIIADNATMDKFNVYVAPGRITSKNQDVYEFDLQGFDFYEAEDYIYYMEIPMSELSSYVENVGLYELSTQKDNAEVFGNQLLYFQSLLLNYFQVGNNQKYFPVVKQTCSINGVTYNPENWVSDLAVLSAYNDSLSNEEKEVFYEQYLVPVPTAEDAIVTIPMHMYKLENVNALLVALSSMFGVLESNDCLTLDVLAYILYAQYQMAIQKGDLPDLGLNYLEVFLANAMGQLDIPSYGYQEMMNYFVDLEYYPIVEGNLIPLDPSMMEMFVSEYFVFDSVDYAVSEPGLSTNGLMFNKYETSSGVFVVNNDCLYSSDRTVFYGYPTLKQDNEFTVLNGTTKIENFAFANNPYLQKLTIPKTVTTIGDGIFRHSQVGVVNIYYETYAAAKTELAKSLKDSNVTTLNIYSTNYISPLDINELKANSSIETINVIYIDNPSGLRFTQNDGGLYVSEVPDKTLTEIVVPNSVDLGTETLDVIGVSNRVFALCTELTKIGLPSTLKYLGAYNFETCTKLKQLFIPETVTTLGLGNVHPRLVVYTKSDSIYVPLINMYDNSIGLSFEFRIDGANADFEYAITVGTEVYHISGEMIKTEISNYNIKMILFPTQGVKVSLTTYIKGYASDSEHWIDGYQEQISLAQKVDGTNYTQIMGSATDETNYNQYSTTEVNAQYPKNGEPDVYIQPGNEYRLRIFYTVMQQVQCFTAGTQVTLADGTYKNIEDVTYDDLLMVYDFDIGKFGVSYPAWIAKPNEYDHYYIMEFDDGSTLEVVLAHRLFTDDDLDYENSIDADYSSIGKKFIRQVFENGLPVIKLVTCTNITRVNEQCMYYNIVTSQAINFMSNGFVGAPSNANMYTFEKLDDQTYVHNREQLSKTKSGTTDPETGTMYSYETYNNPYMPYYIYVSWRLGEAKNMVDILKQVPPFNQYPPEYAEAYAINLISSYFDANFEKDMTPMPRDFKVTLSDRVQNERYDRNEFFTLPTPNNTTNFVGWYNTFDGKIYQPGDMAEVYMNTHFIARYAA